LCGFALFRKVRQKQIENIFPRSSLAQANSQGLNNFTTVKNLKKIFLFDSADLICL